MPDLLFDPSHVVFEAEGTRYDLVMTNDPYGGVLVVWPQGKQFWRWHPGDYLKSLSKCNEHDAHNIFEYLEATNDE